MTGIRSPPKFRMTVLQAGHHYQSLWGGGLIGTHHQPQWPCGEVTDSATCVWHGGRLSFQSLSTHPGSYCCSSVEYMEAQICGWKAPNSMFIPISGYCTKSHHEWKWLEWIGMNVGFGETDAQTRECRVSSIAWYLYDLNKWLSPF